MWCSSIWDLCGSFCRVARFHISCRKSFLDNLKFKQNFGKKTKKNMKTPWIPFFIFFVMKACWKTLSMSRPAQLSTLIYYLSNFVQHSSLSLCYRRHDFILVLLRLPVGSRIRIRYTNKLSYWLPRWRSFTDGHRETSKSLYEFNELLRWLPVPVTFRLSIPVHRLQFCVKTVSPGQGVSFLDVHGPDRTSHELS